MTRCDAAPRARTRFAHDSRTQSLRLSSARTFVPVSPHVAVFSVGPRREATQDGVQRRVIILSIETHPDMMSLCTGLGTHGHAWVRWAAALRSARRLPHARPPPGGARAPHLTSHPTPHISPHAHRPTPTAARHSPQSHTVDKTQVTRTHTTSHHKVPHRCPRPGLVKAVRVPTLRVCIYQPSVQSTCPRPLPSHTALHESHYG